MRLRRAIIEDFEACKELYDNPMTDVLYNDFEQAEEESDEKNLLDDFFLPEDFRFALEDYEHYFDDHYGRIYIFEDDDAKMIAYVKLFKIQGFRWKLAELRIEDECQTMEVIAQILNDLMLEKGIKEIDVCTPIPSVLKKLMSLGYHRTSSCTSYLRRSKKSG